MASKQQEEEDGSVTALISACSPGQILKGDEDGKDWLACDAFPARRCAQGCCGSVCRLVSCKLGESHCMHWSDSLEMGWGSGYGTAIRTWTTGALGNNVQWH